MEVWTEIMNLLSKYSTDSVACGFIFFIYSMAAAVVLPIPVEIGLILNSGTPFIFKALILGTGKAVGRIPVFYIGFKIESRVRGWSQKWRFARWFVEKCTRLVETTATSVCISSSAYQEWSILSRRTSSLSSIGRGKCLK
ncbi:MAG: hypothetical protein ABSB83_03210 [Methanomassiliicoccales archaeon]